MFALAGEAELHPRRDLVALDERVDLLDAFALRERQHEHALRVASGPARKSITRIVFARRWISRHSETASFWKKISSTGSSAATSLAARLLRPFALTHPALRNRAASRKHCATVTSSLVQKVKRPVPRRRVKSSTVGTEVDKSRISAVHLYSEWSAAASVGCRLANHASSASVGRSDAEPSAMRLARAGLSGSRRASAFRRKDPRIARKFMPLSNGRRA